LPSGSLGPTMRAPQDVKASGNERCRYLTLRQSGADCITTDVTRYAYSASTAPYDRCGLDSESLAASKSSPLVLKQPTYALVHGKVRDGPVWTAPRWQGESSLCGVGRSSHVFGLLARFARPLAIMHSADQVPVKSTHSMMPWPKWVVLIAGSTGAALRAVRPPNRYVTPDVRRDFLTRRARSVPCSAHPWPPWPPPCGQSCWRARSQQLWSVDALAVP
jgi:hypothetical protein